MSDTSHGGEEHVLTFNVPPFTPEEMARALQYVVWKYGHMKLHRGPERVLTVDFGECNEPDVPHIIDSP